MARKPGLNPGLEAASVRTALRRNVLRQVEYTELDSSRADRRRLDS